MPRNGLCCDRRSRRVFLADTSLGLTGLVLGTLLPRRVSAVEAWTAPDGKPHFQPKAKRVIWLFMLGGVSHVESFDPKPVLNKYAGKQLAETPYKDALESPFVKENLKAFVPGQHQIKLTLYPMQSGYRESRKTGALVSDWFPHVSDMMHEIALIRSTWTTDNDHGAILQFHTGRHIFDGYLPTVGSWMHYGLGTLNENLPEFVVLGEPPGDCCGGMGTHGSGYLGPEHAGVHHAGLHGAVTTRRAEHAEAVVERYERGERVEPGHGVATKRARAAATIRSTQVSSSSVVESSTRW